MDYGVSGLRSYCFSPSWYMFCFYYHAEVRFLLKRRKALIMGNIRNRFLGFLLCAAVLISGCGRDAVEEVDAEEAVVSENQELSLGFDEPEARPLSRPVAARRAVTLAEDAGIDELFTALDKLEREAAFAEAWQMAREFRAENAAHPGIGAVDERINRLNLLRRDAPELIYALNQLTDPNPTVRDIVQRQLLRGGEVARIVLRKAVREEDAQLAQKAARLLRQMGDSDGFLDVVERLRQTDNAGLRKELIDISSQMLEAQNSTAIQLSAKILAEAQTAEYIPLAAGIYRRLIEEDPDGTAAPAAREAVDNYLLRLIDVASGDREILRDASTAAALSGDKQLMSRFLQPGLMFAYYEAGRREITSAHDDDTFDELDPVKTGATDIITIELRDRQEDIGMVFTGLIDVREAGEYTFYTNSDDGSFLFIGDEKIVDNGGLHGMQERSGTIELSAGLHPFRLTWFQAGGGLGLEVHWEGPGIEKGDIPAERFFHHLSDAGFTGAM